MMQAVAVFIFSSFILDTKLTSNKLEIETFRQSAIAQNPSDSNNRLTSSAPLKRSIDIYKFSLKYYFCTLI